MPLCRPPGACRKPSQTHFLSPFGDRPPRGTSRNGSERGVPLVAFRRRSLRSESEPFSPDVKDGWGFEEIRFARPRLEG